MGIRKIHLSSAILSNRSAMRRTGWAKARSEGSAWRRVVSQHSVFPSRTSVAVAATTAVAAVGGGVVSVRRQRQRQDELPSVEATASQASHNPELPTASEPSRTSEHAEVNDGTSDEPQREAKPASVEYEAPDVPSAPSSPQAPVHGSNAHPSEDSLRRETSSTAEAENASRNRTGLATERQGDRCADGTDNQHGRPSLEPESAAGEGNDKRTTVSLDEQRSSTANDGWVSDLVQRTLREPASLEAIESGAMRAMQQQARIDAQVLREELGRRDEQHSHSLKRLADSDAELLQSAYSELERAQQKQSEVEAERRRSESELVQKHKQEMQHQAQALKQQSEEALANERRDSLYALDGVREQLNALSSALSTHAQRYDRSASMHRLFATTLALDLALVDGEPLQRTLRDLKACVSGTHDDSTAVLVHSVAPAFERTANAGVPTRSQLHQQLTDVLQRVRRTYVLPDGPAGIAAHAFASFASALRLSEPPSPADQQEEQGSGVEAAAARVRKHIERDDYNAAAAELENATANSLAKHEVAEWVKGARQRAEAELAMEALRANYACLAASFA